MQEASGIGTHGAIGGQITAQLTFRAASLALKIVVAEVTTWALVQACVVIEVGIDRIELAAQTGAFR